MAYTITIEVEALSPRVTVEGLAALAEKVMAGEGCEDGTTLSCVLVDDAAIRTLNSRFLGVDEPTDVLAFPDEPDAEFIEGHVGPPHLGDIAISVERATEQADEAGHGLREELSHLLVHGILHLAGYDHVEGADAEARMRAREEHYLGEIDVHRA